MTRAVHAVAGAEEEAHAVGVLVVALAAGFAAFAYFTSSGSGSGSASTGTLSPPTAVSGVATGSTVAVSWTASSGPLVPTGYYVTRSSAGGPAVAACSSAPGGPYATSPCNDLGVPNGTWTYTVTAVFNSWTASASSSAVTVAATATHLAFNVQPSNTVSGVAISPSVTVRVLDASNNVVTGDNATKVTLAIGTNPGGGTLSGTLERTAASGVATFSGLSIDKAGTGYTLAATDTTGGGGIHPLTGNTSSTFNITPGAAHHIDLSSSTADLASGSTRTLTATIKDANGRRYKAELVEKLPYLLELIRYMALNPMRTEPPLCAAPELHVWSSYRILLGLASRPAWLTVDWVLTQFGDDYETSRSRLKAFVSEGLAMEAPDAIGGMYFGSEQFIAEVAVGDPIPETPRAHWQPLRPPLTVIFETMDDPIIAAYREYGYTLSQIGTHLGCHYQTVSRRLRQGENDASS